MFELVVVGIMFAALIGVACFATAYIASETYKLFREIRNEIWKTR